uniref:HPP transmembrane region domain-containing protein n=2 Tax=Kalmanozyma brasiliensis (strain GHG001) TaxID=1365824 RepID=V5ERK7_KALBG
MEMRDARSTRTGSILRRGSQKKVQPSRLVAAGSTSQHGHEYISPSTEGSTQRDSPHLNHLSSPSDEGQTSRAFKKIKGERFDGHTPSPPTSNTDNDHDNDGEEERHPVLDALYPLTNFIGYRPLSHPHTPADRRLSRHDPGFSRFHHICGQILTFGLPVSGSTGETARYRDPHTGRIEFVHMYRDQVGAKVVNSIHSVIAAWVIIALLSLLSRSPFHRAHNAPLIIGAFATEAVVSFYAFRTPLAQPKNILFGNTISAIIGVAMTKAFQSTNYTVTGVYGIDWAVAATTVAAALFGMQILGFTHPPGAAIAILAVTNQETHDLAWWLVPIVIFGSLIVIGWAMIINNVGGRRYPENWLYANAFLEPPIIGPERLPFNNSPWHPPRSRHGQKRKRERAAAEQEKGFYRVPDSGARVTHGFGSSAKTATEAPPKTGAAAGATSQNTTEAATENEKVSLGTQVVGGSKQSLGAGTNSNGDDGRTTRASQVTKVESIDASAVPPVPSNSTTANAGSRAAQHAFPIHGPTSSTGHSATAPSASGSKMIEQDASLVSRNNSKSSKKSRRSVIIHVNENRRASASSASKIPPVPAVQWRGSQTGHGDV